MFEIFVKQDGKTVWESLKAVRYQAAEIYDALFEVAEQSCDPKARSKEESLCKKKNLITSI